MVRIMETPGRFETAEKVVFRKKLKIFGVLKCIIKQEMGLRSNSGGPFFYDYIDVLEKWTFSVISNRPLVSLQKGKGFFNQWLCYRLLLIFSQRKKTVFFGLF